MATPTAAAASAQMLYERPDIHKSCKSLETLLSVFSDYCEAAGAVVSLQKKLAKALRENATSKATNDVAANAFNASATIFEALSDIDSKFAKIADKEYDSISSEVKKWFKKLAKEEKNHDEKITNANGKIKQAGQIYEKKSKKNAREANDEHARYINLISALGPEISQEKYNHTLLVSQRHSSATFSVAASVSRLADNEWVRTCEGVRKFAPTVGPLNEYRALCEGGWAGPMPADLPDIEPQPELQQAQLQPAPPAMINLNAKAPSEEDRPPPPTYRNVEPSSKSAETAEITQSPRPPHLNLQQMEKEQPPPSLGSPLGPRQPISSPNAKSTPPSSFDPPRALVDPNTGSVRSLSAFPAPPTHVPPPLSPTPRHQQPSYGQSSQSSSTSNTSFAASNRPDVRIPTTASPEDSPVNSPVSNSTPPSPQQRFHDPEFVKALSPAVNEASDVRRPLPVRAMTSAEHESPKGDYLSEEHGYGSVYNPPVSPTRPSDSAKPKPVERSDTANSNGSIVAAMRNRYSYNSGASSPPPKEPPVPRLPMSVTDLATRYQPADGPSSPSPRVVASPTPTRALPSVDSFTQARQAEASFRDPNPSFPEPYRGGQPYASRSGAGAPSAPGAEDTIRRQRRLEELEIQEKEQELRARELDIALKTRELERQRDTVRMGMPQPQPMSRESYSASPTQQRDSYAGIGAGGGGGGRAGASGELERQRDLLMRERYDSTPTPRASQYLVPPQGASPSRTPSDESSSPSHTHEQLNALHPAYCTCDTCKYATTSTSTKRPGTGMGTEKKGGWMRRLSMPIVAGLDAKRNGNTVKGIGGGGLMSLDGKKGASTTMLAVGAREDGRVVSGGRRSYDASGISNRSVTNLNFGRR